MELKSNCASRVFCPSYDCDRQTAKESRKKSFTLAKQKRKLEKCFWRKIQPETAFNCVLFYESKNGSHGLFNKNAYETIRSSHEHLIWYIDTASSSKNSSKCFHFSVFPACFITIYLSTGIFHGRMDLMSMPVFVAISLLA